MVQPGVVSPLEELNYDTGDTENESETPISDAFFEDLSNIRQGAKEKLQPVNDAIGRAFGWASGGRFGISESAVGSEVLSRGLLIVDPNEEIIPADIRLAAETPVRQLLTKLSTKSESESRGIEDPGNVKVSVNLTVPININGTGNLGDANRLAREVEKQLIQLLRSYQVQNLIKEAAAQGHHRGTRHYRG